MTEEIQTLGEELGSGLERQQYAESLTAGVLG
jgi:hypothetical protein